MTKLIKGLDLREGDIVQIMNYKQYTGRVGQIIGISLYKNPKGREGLLYTIKLSDRDSVTVTANKCKLIKPADY